MRCWFEGAAKLAIPLMEIGLLFSILLALGGCISERRGTRQAHMHYCAISSVYN